MTPDPESSKARLDKALADIRMLQARLENLTPEQREKMGDKLRAQMPQLIELKKRLEAAAAMFPKRGESMQDRIAEELAARSPYPSVFRGMKTKKDVLQEWGNSWLIPPQFMSRKSSIKQGKAIAKFWAEVLDKTPTKRTVLEPVATTWSAAPMLVLPALTTQISALVLDAIDGPGKTAKMPFDVAAQIVKRIFVEVQIQAGTDPAPTEQLEALLAELSKSASGEPVEGDPKVLALKAMVLYAWLAFGLPEKSLLQ